MHVCFLYSSLTGFVGSFCLYSRFTPCLFVFFSVFLQEYMFAESEGWRVLYAEWVRWVLSGAFNWGFWGGETLFDNLIKCDKCLQVQETFGHSSYAQRNDVSISWQAEQFESSGSSHVSDDSFEYLPPPKWVIFVLKTNCLFVVTSTMARFNYSRDCCACDKAGAVKWASVCAAKSEPINTGNGRKVLRQNPHLTGILKIFR